MAKEEDFDDILVTLGLGKWNLTYYFCMGIYGFMVPCFILAGTYIAPSIKYECDTSSLGIGIIHSPDECSYTLSRNTTLKQSSYENRCTNWTYNDPTTFVNTLTSEFNLVCDDSYLRPTFQTVLTFGNFIGAPVNGLLSDRYGRKSLVVAASFLSITSVFISSFLSNLNAIITMRFLTGLATIPVIQTGYTLCMEVCEPKHRSSVGILLSLPWAFGTIWWGCLGYLIRDWRWLMRASALPSVVFFICLWVMDESPRWLIIRGHHEKALQALTKAARLNHATLPTDQEMLKKILVIQQSSMGENESEEKTENLNPSGFKHKLRRGIRQIGILYKTPELRRRTLLMYVVFLVSASVFYGLSLSAINYQLNPYLYMIVGGLTEVPAYTITVPIITRWGRIAPMSAFYFICGVTILILAFLPPDPKLVVITLAMLGKFTISASYQIIYLLATEVFPTEVRMQGLGTSGFVSAVGSTTAPYITELIGTRRPWVPSIIFGGLSLVAGVAAIFLPETLNKHLPETVHQLEMEAKLNKRRRASFQGGLIKTEGHVTNNEDVTPIKHTISMESLVL